MVYENSCWEHCNIVTILCVREIIFSDVLLASPTEDGGGLVIRGYESHGRPAEVTLQLPLEDAAIDLEFKPYEIKTLRFDEKTKVFTACDLLENA